MGVRRRLMLATVRLFGRLGLIRVPYGGDYQAAQGNVDRRNDEGDG